MEQVIYGDVLFVINFSMDFLALYIAGKIQRYKMSTLALILAASLGSVYAVITLFVSSTTILNNIINLCVAALMCYIVYNNKSFFSFLRSAVLFYGISFLMGGGMSALYNLLNSKLANRRIVINGDLNTLQSEIPISWFIALAVISAFLSILCGFIFKSKSTQKPIKVEAEFMGKRISFEGLSDSGNLLCEPIGGLPVIVTGYNTISSILPPSLRPLFRHSDISIIPNLDFELAKRIRIIPASGVGSEGLLIGIIPDKISIDGEQKQACLAAGSREGNYGGYAGIVPANVM